MKHVKFGIILLTIAVLMSGCGSSESAVEKDAKKQMKEAITYYSDEIMTKLPELAGTKDADAIASELESAIAQSNTYVDLFMGYMDNDELSEDSQTAAMYLKTAYYGVQTTALEPILEIMRTNTGESPDYATLVTNAKTTYVDEASKLLK